MRPIDADTTLDLLKSLGSRDYRRTKGTIAEAEKMLANKEYTPTLDVEPVRHGHWINAYPDIEPNPMFMYGICSNCGFEQGLNDKLNYCPNCGAKMDEVSE